MVRVRIIAKEFDFDARRWEEHPRAELLVEGDRFRLTGPEQGLLDLEMTLIDPETGERFGFRDDPSRWARLLPTAYRVGDVSVEVEEIGAPTAPAPAQTPERELVFAFSRVSDLGSAQ